MAAPHVQILPSSAPDVRRVLTRDIDGRPVEVLEVPEARAAAMPRGGVFGPFTNDGGRMVLGAPLARTVASLRPDPAVICALFLRILRDLELLHAQGGAHGAIHADAIGVTNDGFFLVRPALHLVGPPTDAPSAFAADVLLVGTAFDRVATDAVAAAPKLRHWLAGCGVAGVRIGFADAREARQALYAAARRLPLDDALAAWLAANAVSLPADPVAFTVAPAVPTPPRPDMARAARHWVERELARLRTERYVSTRARTEQRLVAQRARAEAEHLRFEQQWSGAAADRASARRAAEAAESRRRADVLWNAAEAERRAAPTGVPREPEVEELAPAAIEPLPERPRATVRVEMRTRPVDRRRTPENPATPAAAPPPPDPAVYIAPEPRAVLAGRALERPTAPEPEAAPAAETPGVEVAREAREAAEREAREAAEREAREAAEREAREAAERDAREAAEREAREAAEREAREAAEREAREAAERDAREAAERDAREAAERDAREAAEREAREAAERDAREAAERDAREAAEREAREAAERARRERAEQEAREIARREAHEAAEREAREAAARADRDARDREEAARREAAEAAARREAEQHARREREEQARHDEAARRDEHERRERQEAARRADLAREEEEGRRERDELARRGDRDRRAREEQVRDEDARLRDEHERRAMFAQARADADERNRRAAEAAARAGDEDANDEPTWATAQPLTGTSRRASEKGPGKWANPQNSEARTRAREDALALAMGHTADAEHETDANVEPPGRGMDLAPPASSGPDAATVARWSAAAAATAAALWWLFG